MKENAKDIHQKLTTFKTSIPKCELLYPNLDISRGVPPTIAQTLIETGVDAKRGEYVTLSNEDLTTTYKFFQESGEKLAIVNRIETMVEVDEKALENRETPQEPAESAEPAEPTEPAEPPSPPPSTPFIDFIHKLIDPFKTFCANLFN